MTLAAILSGFALSLAAPWIHRVGGRRTGWLLALLPLGLTLYFLRFIRQVAGGETIFVSYPWVPSLGVNLSVYIDGLSLLFALLISAIGALVLIYSSSYIAEHQESGRFYAYLLAFMASMLGIVLSGDLLALFVFWELTTISSYLLIGFEHRHKEVRENAQQALLITGGGGLALLAGLLMLVRVGASGELPTLLERGDSLRGDALYPAILLLILLGAYSKSAQVPFHFWLPNAMEAPTPVSAYLHSATMVKAGIYLLARFSPMLGGTTLWWYALTSVGAISMVVGAYLAIRQTDIKRLLAYSTISALGMLTLLLGQDSELAAKAAMTFLLAHALYKGALFLIAGNLDHATQTRELTQLGGLRRAMPLTAASAMLAAISMAGIPPALGYIGKELLYESGLKAERAALALTTALVAANILYVAAAGMVGLLPFTGSRRETARAVHEAPPGMWLPAALLAALGLLAGLMPWGAQLLVAPAVSAIRLAPASAKLELWHGITPMLLLSLLTLAGGAVVYTAHGWLRRVSEPLAAIGDWGPARWYSLTLALFNWLARYQNRLLLNGYLRSYILIILTATVLLVGYPLVRYAELSWPLTQPLYVHELGLAAMIIVATVIAIRAPSHVGSVVALGVTGYGVALIYVLFSAPDLAITQVMVDTLTVILFVLVFYRLPEFRKLTHEPIRLRDALVALSIGGIITTLVLAAENLQLSPSISTYYVSQSVPAAHGQNVVNTILTDFRALDTLGEITVLMLAGIGVFALLKLRLEEGKEP